jgi:hypothetical protein
LFEQFASPGNPLLGFLANTLHSCLRLLADGGDVSLGCLLQVLVFDPAAELLHVRRGVGLRLIEDRLPRRLGGQRHCLRQVRKELVRVARRRLVHAGLHGL